MAEELTFGERLILAEETERAAAPTPADDRVILPDPDRRETVVIERRSFTTADSFHFKEPGRELPIDGPGSLVQLLVAVDSDQFDVFVEADDEVLVSDAFTDLQDLSSEFNRISAFQQAGGGDFIFSVKNYEFQHTFDAVIQPNQSMTFARQRAEIDLVRDVFM